MSPRLALLAALPLAICAAPARAANADFASATARTVPAGRAEVGLFASLRYGLAERVELATHPLWFFLVPNAEVRVGWGTLAEIEVASAHGVYDPAPLMNALAREGTGGVVPPDVRYPHLLATRHSLLATRELSGHLVTARAGARLAWRLGRWDGPPFWSQVEWHLAWPRMASWFTGWSLEGGLAVQGPIRGRLGYEARVDAFLLPGMNGDRAVEGSALLTLRPRRSLLLRAGAKWSWAELPQGARRSVPLPLLDLVWSFDAPWAPPRR